MRRLAFALGLLLGGCENGHPPPARHTTAPPVQAAAPAKAAPAANTSHAAPDEGAREDPGLTGLSPAQRRAYELGYRDCSSGRYAPANHLEAYRIGCGAAHDRPGGGRPRG